MSLSRKTSRGSAYIERLEQFFEANDIADRKKVATLLSVKGHNYIWTFEKFSTAPQA